MLSDVEISEGTKNIGTYAFDDCNSLVSIALPKSIERIESTGRWAHLPELKQEQHKLLLA